MYGGDWEEFMHKTAKIFKGRIPDKLLMGLKRDANVKLQMLCNRYMLDNARYRERVELQEKSQTERIRRWEERRDRGNHDAWCRYHDTMKAREALKKEIIQKEREYDEQIEQMKMQMLSKRDQEIEMLCNSLRNIDV